MTNNLKEFRKNAHKALDSFLDVWGVEEFLIINQKDHDRNWAYAINQKEKELLEKFEEIVGKDEPGKSEFDLGSEFSTPRDIRRNASNYLKAEIRYGIKQLKEELKEVSND